MSPFVVRHILWCLLVAGTSAAASRNEKMAAVSSEPGRVLPAETRPCVDCHAFEFMERALRDLYKAAYNLDSQTETLLLRAEDRGLCDCLA
ncbi:NELL2-interacting cell ontogeny regulator 1-like [Pseudophryne corroboree]|uniref:NELL2-interacting cell ontogeny regulator 1-like n=1 Tax=Pseudophryne corroboree TaxID=495146 RepID=UPI0030816EFC